MVDVVIDIGNTRIKTALFENGVIHESHFFELDDPDFELFCRNQDSSSGIISSVSAQTTSAPALAHLTHFHRFSHQSKLPFTNKYETPETLGPDRLAVVAGAKSFFPDVSLLCIDAGSCITYDILNADNEYLGGAISPGLMMRYQALHTFTGKLPLVEHTDFNVLTGRNTQQSILAGVQNGILGEVEQIVEQYEKQYPRLQVTLSGGDTAFFEKRLKCNIFAHPELVIKGLYHILKLNEA